MKTIRIVFVRILITFIFLQIPLCSFSQGFKVKDFKLSINDGAAFHAPKDENGHSCALIKIRTDCLDLKFDGDIVGEVENKTNEYWVYVSPKSPSLRILHPNFIPLVVVMADYGVEMLSKATYVMRLSETKFKKEKLGVTITAKPDDAELDIDGSRISNLSGNGYYELYLPKGEHVCRISKRGYRPQVHTVRTGKISQSLDIELESVKAELEVRSKTGTAQLYIDGELKGSGAWKGELLAGEHVVEARQINFKTFSQKVFLSEKEKKALSIPELIRSKGILLLESTPSGLPVVIDGKYVGKTPYRKELETGVHLISSNGFGYMLYRNEVEVEEDKTNTVNVEVKFKSELYKDAYSGNLQAIKKIANSVQDNEESLFWAERYPDFEDLIMDEQGHLNDRWIYKFIEMNKPDRAMQIVKIVGFIDIYMVEIGNCYLRNKDFDKAKQCFEQADERGYEGLGDYYLANGNKQKAIEYYIAYLNSDLGEELAMSQADKKLKSLGVDLLKDSGVDDDDVFLSDVGNPCFSNSSHSIIIYFDFFDDVIIEKGKPTLIIDGKAYRGVYDEKKGILTVIDKGKNVFEGAIYAGGNLLKGTLRGRKIVMKSCYD